MNILLEIGLEEIPARFLKPSLNDIETFISKELKEKAQRWADKAGDNLDELGNEIKMSFNEFKESLKSHDNKKQVDDSDL